MALKSYSSFKKSKKSKKKKLAGDMITGGVTALIGIGMLSETAKAVSK